MTLLKVDKLTVAYGDKAIVKKCSFEIEQGDVIVVLGASGDGKTTLLKTIAGLLPIKSGQIIFNGEKIKDAANKLVPGHPQIKLVNQDFGLDDFHTVEENLRLVLRPFDEAYKKTRIDFLLRLTKLTTLKSHKAKDLSGGQKQRLAIARALADEPELILLDEPFNQLDYQTKNQIETHIRNYIRKQKITTILVTHNGVEAMEWADKIIYLQKGKLQRIATPAEFYNQPQNNIEAQFFGELNKLKIKNDLIYFRPGVFSLKKTKLFHQKLNISFLSKQDLGWYSAFTFSCDNQSFKLFSQADISNQKEIFIQPLLQND